MGHTFGHRAAVGSIRRILGIDKRSSLPRLTGAAAIRASGPIHPIERIGGKPEVSPGGSVDKIKGKGRKNK